MKLLTLLGPTAVGKTSLAAQLAARLNGEIISADSRQVYRGMDIGTGKDLQDYIVNTQAIPYHLIDIVDAGYKYSVYEYQQDFKEVFSAICKRKKTPILCGGSGMYIEAVVENYNLPEVPPNISLRAELEQLSTSNLIEQLKDLKSLHNVSDLDSRKRIIRAIEVAKAIQNTEETPSQAKLQNVYIGLYLERGERRNRITERLHARLRDGMLEEVQTLLNSGIKASNLEYYGLEYKFITAHLTGKLSYSDMVSQLNVAIHQFAKRQMTWFRRVERKGSKIHWIDALLPMEQKLEQASNIYLNT
ncbi:MAG: tRNA (adenosine(37)-N6)-dimethylallyltransferase MiaA [Bacteroidales bacterium]